MLPKKRRKLISDDSNPFLHVLPDPTPCSGCGALLYPSEMRSNFCMCKKGESAMKKLPPMPKELEELCDEPDFKKYSRVINQATSFGCTGTNSGEGWDNLPQPSCTRLQGSLYSYVPGFDEENKTSYPLYWFINDPEQLSTQGVDFLSETIDKEKLKREKEMNPAKIAKLDKTIDEMELRCRVIKGYIDKVNKILQENNPLAKRLIQLGALPESQAKDMKIELFYDDTSKELACYFSSDDGPGEMTKRYVLTLDKNRQYITRKFNFPQYGALKYTLFRPRASPGYFDQRMVDGKKMTQIEYYRRLLLCEPRYGKLGALMNEWLVDMFCRVEEERLQYFSTQQYQNRLKNVRNRQVSQDKRRERANRKKSRDPEKYAHINSRNVDGVQSSKGRVYFEDGRVILPNSFTGSPRHKKSHCQDALACLGAFGKAHFFITFTCNPNWREFEYWKRERRETSTSRMPEDALYSCATYPGGCDFFKWNEAYNKKLQLQREKEDPNAAGNFPLMTTEEARKCIKEGVYCCFCPRQAMKCISENPKSKDKTFYKCGVQVCSFFEWAPGNVPKRPREEIVPVEGSLPNKKAKIVDAKSDDGSAEGKEEKGE